MHLSLRTYDSKSQPAAHLAALRVALVRSTAVVPSARAPPPPGPAPFSPPDVDFAGQAKLSWSGASLRRSSSLGKQSPGPQSFQASRNTSGGAVRPHNPHELRTHFATPSGAGTAVASGLPSGLATPPEYGGAGVSVDDPPRGLTGYGACGPANVEPGCRIITAWPSPLTRPRHLLLLSVLLAGHDVESLSTVRDGTISLWWCWPWGRGCVLACGLGGRGWVMFPLGKRRSACLGLGYCCRCTEVLRMIPQRSTVLSSRDGGWLFGQMDDERRGITGGGRSSHL